MNDPWTWTTVWGLTVRAGGGLERGGQREKNWDNFNRILKEKNQCSQVGIFNWYVARTFKTCNT